MSSDKKGESRMAENEKSPRCNEPSGRGMVIDLDSLSKVVQSTEQSHIRIATPKGTIISIKKNLIEKSRNLIFVAGDITISIDLTDEIKETLTRLLSRC